MTAPLVRNTDRPAILPVKYGDNLWLRAMSEADVERFSVRKIRLRCRIADPDDPSDPSAQTLPVYGPIDIPGLEGRKIVGCYAPAFSIDPSGALDPSVPDPSAGDIGVVRVIAAPYSERALRFGLFALDAPGLWPGATTGGLVTPSPKAAAGKYGGENDYPIGDTPATASYIRQTVVHIQQETDPSAVDYSDPSSIIEYQLMLSTGSRIRVEVPATDPQPALKQPWPLDLDDTRVNYQVLDTHQAHQDVYPKRNAYVVPNITDDPLHSYRQVDHINRYWVTAVRTEFTQNPVDPSVAQVQRVTLSNGTTVSVPVGVLIVPGMEFDPSGMDPSEGDPSGLSPEAINPAEWWEFDMYLMLEQDDTADGTVGGGYAGDVWPIMPADLGGAGALSVIIA